MNAQVLQTPVLHTLYESRPPPPLPRPRGRRIIYKLFHILKLRYISAIKKD